MVPEVGAWAGFHANNTADNASWIGAKLAFGTRPMAKSCAFCSSISLGQLPVGSITRHCNLIIFLFVSKALELNFLQKIDCSSISTSEQYLKFSAAVVQRPRREGAFDRGT